MSPCAGSRGGSTTTHAVSSPPGRGISARAIKRARERDRRPLLSGGIAAYAQFIGGNYTEAVNLARKAIRQRSDFVGGLRVLTAAAATASDMYVAQPTLQDLRRAQPNISLAWIAAHMPIRHDARPRTLSRGVPQGRA